MVKAKSRKITWFITWFALLFIPVSVIALALSIPIANNITASHVKKELLKTPLPQDTKLVDSISIAKKVIGSGNGLQFFGAILIKSDLPIEELEDHYSTYRTNEWEFRVAEQHQANLDVIEHGTYSFSKVTNVKDFDGYYVVYSLGSSQFPLRDWDLRGH